MPISHATPVSIKNLRVGLQRRGRRVKEWSDLHNALYCQLEDYRQRGLTHDFWKFLVDELWNWRAIRPYKKSVIRDEGLERLPQLQKLFRSLARKGKDGLPTIESVNWKDVSPLFEVAREIKNTKTYRPTFASKLCHFLVPSIYFVIDGKLVKGGWNGYQNYWEECKKAWMEKRVEEKTLINEMRGEMLKKGCTPCRTYPWATKITELCQFSL